MNQATVTTLIVAATSAGPETDFFNKALCPQTDPEVFFPEKGGSAGEARRICDRCEVTAQCLQWALDNDIEHGIWGGVTGRERRNLLAGRTVSPKLLSRVKSLGISVPDVASEDVQTQRLAG